LIIIKGPKTTSENPLRESQVCGREGEDAVSDFNMIAINT
jgi:hypothetical protein